MAISQNPEVSLPINALGDAQPVLESTIVNAEGLSKITLEGDPWFLRAEFDRSGPDLRLSGPDGQELIIRDFFNQTPPPDIATADGVVLKGSVATQLAGPLAPGQFAQAAPASATEPIGRVETAAGEVKATRADGTEVTLNQGDPVFEGDILETAGESAVGIVFADESTFSLGEEGRMTLDDLIYDPGEQEGTMSVNLLQGAFTFVSGQIAKTGPDAMVVTTPTATIGIRGTLPGGNIGPDGVTTIVLLPELGFVGEMTITNEAGTQIVNQPGLAINIVSFNAPPSPPFVMSPEQIGQAFGAALSALPNVENLIPAEVREGAAQGQAQQQEAEEAVAEAEAKQAEAEAAAAEAEAVAEEAAAEAAAAEAAAAEAAAEAEALAAEAAAVEAAAAEAAIEAEALAAEAAAAEAAAAEAQALAQSEGATEAELAAAEEAAQAAEAASAAAEQATQEAEQAQATQAQVQTQAAQASAQAQAAAAQAAQAGSAVAAATAELASAEAELALAGAEFAQAQVAVVQTSASGAVASAAVSAGVEVPGIDDLSAVQESAIQAEAAATQAQAQAAQANAAVAEAEAIAEAAIAEAEAAAVEAEVAAAEAAAAEAEVAAAEAAAAEAEGAVGLESESENLPAPEEGPLDAAVDAPLAGSINEATGTPIFTPVGSPVVDPLGDPLTELLGSLGIDDLLDTTLNIPIIETQEFAGDFVTTDGDDGDDDDVDLDIDLTTIFPENLAATTGDDVLVGGDGDTRFTMTLGATEALSSMGGFDLVDGGAGTDEIAFLNLTDFEGIFEVDANSLTYESADNVVGTGQAFFNSVEQLYVDNGTEDEVRLDTTGGSAGGFGYVISRGSNNDTIDISSGTLLSAASATGVHSINDTLTIGSVLFGGGGNDTITGSSAEDIIYGGAGSDTLTGGEGNDELFGGIGSDVFHVQGTDTINGGAGADTVQFYSTGVNIAEVSSVETIIGGASNNDTLKFSDDTGVTVTGIYDVETIAGGLGTDSISLSSSDSSLQAITDVETLTLDGNTLTFAGAVDTIMGGSSAEDITFTSTTTIANTVSLGDGNDTFVFGTNIASGTTFDGGAGSSDSLHLAATSGVNTISIANTETVTAASADDLITYTSLATSGTSIDGGVGSDVLNLTNTGNNVVSVTNVETIDVLSSSTGNNTITVTGSGAATVTGAGGADTIVGGSGNDTIDGADGADLLTGGSGNDILVGGLGADTLTGGSGADVFRYSSTSDGASVNSTSGYDVISDFVSGTDTFDLSGLFASAIDDVSTPDLTLNSVSSGDVDFAANEALFLPSGITPIAITDANLIETGWVTMLAEINTQYFDGTPSLSAALGADGLMVVGGDTDTAVFYYNEDGAADNSIDAEDLTMLALLDNALVVDTDFTIS